jgi:hypothetical protein
MEIVGHSAMEMTMNVYGHVNLETQRIALGTSTSSCREVAVAVTCGCQTDPRSLIDALTWCARRDSNP